MAYSFIQTKTNNATATTSLVIAPDAPIAQGDLVVVSFKVGSPVTGISVTDNASTPNDYDLALGPHVDANGTQIYQLFGVARVGGATSITISWTSSTNSRAVVDEFSGLAAHNLVAFDKAVGAAGSDTDATVALSPSATGELIVAMAGLGGVTGVSAGSGYTLATSNTSLSTAYNLSGAISETAPFVLTGSGIVWNEIAGAYTQKPPPIPIRLDQLSDPVLDVSMNGNKLINLTPGVSNTDAATVSQVGFANPMTTLGDIIYENATPTPARLAGNTTTTKKFLTQIGNGAISAAPAWDTTVPISTVVGTSDIQTLSNKRNMSRITTITSSATPTINTDDCDAVTITALAANITSMTTNLSGTPNNFDKLIIRIKDDGTQRSIVWGASFAAKGVALPTATSVGKILQALFIYDSVATIWGCVAAAQEV